jgi:hypothetical protein
MISFSLGTEPCASGSDADAQYQCWNTNGILKNLNTSLCIDLNQKCHSRESCECPWCDDQWNCPTFEGCKQNGGFLCLNSTLPGTNELWACIPQEWKCDGIWDCPSGEDEGSQFCNVGKCAGNHNLTYWYQCSDTGRCIEVFAVGNGEIDCVNGEDEDPAIIAQVRNGAMTTTTQLDLTTTQSGSTTTENGNQGAPTDPAATSTSTSASTSDATSSTVSAAANTAPTTTTAPATTDSTTTIRSPYGIDLIMFVVGVNFADVCRGVNARFDGLERALALVLNLYPAQVSSSCQRNVLPPLSGRSRVLISSSDSDSEDDEESSEELLYSSPFQKVIAQLSFHTKSQYSNALEQILEFSNESTESDDSSSSSSDQSRHRFAKSIADLSGEIEMQLSHLLRKTIRVKITRVSGNA